MEPVEETDGSCPTRGMLGTLNEILGVVAPPLTRRTVGGGSGVNWLCGDCVARDEKPVYPEVRDGLCGYCWLRRWKLGLVT